jgi:hypothetical protein
MTKRNEVMYSRELNARHLESIIIHCMTVDSISGDVSHLRSIIARFNDPECYTWHCEEEQAAAIRCVENLCDAIAAQKKYFDGMYESGHR